MRTMVLLAIEKRLSIHIFPQHEYNTHSYIRKCEKYTHSYAIHLLVTHSYIKLKSKINTHRSINTTGATSEAGTAYPSGHLNSPLVFSEVRVTRSVVLCVCFVDRCLSCFFWSLHCLSFCLLVFALSVLLRFTDYDYHFGIFKLFYVPYQVISKQNYRRIFLRKKDDE